MATKKKRTRKKERVTKAQSSARKQVYAVILLAVAILTFCIALLKGELIWTWLHNVLLGMFSFSAYVLPALLAFAAIMLALEKDSAKITTRVWQCSTFAVLLNSIVYTYTVDSTAHDYWSAISTCYSDGVQYHGGGVIGALLGWPCERLWVRI